MSYNYQPEEPRSSGNLHPGWSPTKQYTTSYGTSMERSWSSSTGASNQAAYSPDTYSPDTYSPDTYSLDTYSPDIGERNYALSSPVTPEGNSPIYYQEDTRATTTANEPGWSSYYNIVVPNDQHKEAYWELQDRYEPSESMPQRRSVEKQKKSGREVYPCTFPGCTTPKPFKRTADLKRHYDQLHAPPDPSSKFYCDYAKCQRSKEPLGRKDHYRDHLRDFHGEDLSKRSKDGGGTGSRKGKAGNRGDGEGGIRVNVSDRWWRCTKCLERKAVSDGWYCFVCKRACEDERVKDRTRRTTNYSSSQSYPEDPKDPEEEEEGEPEYIKTETSSAPLNSNSNSILSGSQTNFQYSSSGKRASLSYQSSNAVCAYGCNNTWIPNHHNAWDPCPACQGLPLAKPEVSNPTYQGNYSTPFINNDATTFTVAPSASASNWNDQQFQDTGTTNETSYSNDNNDNDNGDGGSSALDTQTTIEGFKSNCGRCSNYQLWDGKVWINCPVCVPTSSSTSTSKTEHSEKRSSRHGHEKKKIRRHSTWFG